MVTSPRYSFRGYDPRIALSNNKDTVKLIIGLIGGISFAADFNWRIFIFTMLGAVGMLAAKLVADALDYYFTDVQLPDSPVAPQ